MDGTLADYFKALRRDLEKIRSPHEPLLNENLFGDELYLQARRHMIASQVGWWLKLEKFKLGFDVLEVVRALGFEVSVLTKGPTAKFNAWSEKVEWCQINLPEDISGVTICHDKGLVYGKVLVDDYPGFILKWLAHRPRGLVIMPANEHNKDFSHPNVIRYDETNLAEVKEALSLLK